MNAQTFSSEDLHRRTLERRAVEAAIWGMPIVIGGVEALGEPGNGSTARRRRS
jgi:hypothetical protein